MGVIGRHIDVIRHARLITLLGPVGSKGLLGLVQKALGVILGIIHYHPWVSGPEVVLLEPGR